LTGFLHELVEANTKLLSELTEYQKTLVTGDIGDIERATPKLDRVAGKIRFLDEERRAFVDEYYLLRGWDGLRNFSSLSIWIKEVGVTDEEAAAFERAIDARMKLIEVLAEVDAQNSLNITLIGQGMSFAEASLKALLGFDNNPPTYGPSASDEDGPSLLDAQA
jgi:hypothetical protein